MKGATLASLALLAGCFLVFSQGVLAQGDGNPEAGKAVLENNCRPCHTVQKGAKPDPYGFNLNLYGLFGRPAATIEGFYYSDAMVDSGIVWSEEIFREYIKDPQAMVESNRMAFLGLEAQQDIDDIVAYLKDAYERGEAAEGEVFESRGAGN